MTVMYILLYNIYYILCLSVDLKLHRSQNDDGDAPLVADVTVIIPLKLEN